MLQRDEIIWQNDVIEMARQAGMELDDSFVLEEDQIWYFCKENFIAFAKLVDAKAVRREREACAMVAQKTVCDTHIPTGVRIYGTAAAKAIRARGEPTLRGEAT